MISAISNWYHNFRHIILCNILTTILRPNFEDPINTPQDLLDQNVTLWEIPGGDIWRQFLMNSPFEELNKVGESMIVAKDWDEWEDGLENGGKF